jgi:hypothetical protein
MEQITLSPEELVRQASMTADTYLGQAVVRIDDHFGEGYAKGHPELVGAFMRTAATDFATSVFAKAVGDVYPFLFSFELQAIRLAEGVHTLVSQNEAAK